MKNKVLYQNERFKVCYIDYGSPFGKLYGIFGIDQEPSPNKQIARNTFKQAVKEADYLNRLNKWREELEKENQ